MDYYDPSYRLGSRIFFKRRRSKKPFLLAVLVFMLMISFFLVGFGSNSSTKQYTPSQSHENSTHSEVTSHPSTAISSLDISGTHAINPMSKSEYPANQDPSITALDGQETGEPIASIEEKSVTVSTGDTLMELLVREGLDRSEAHNVIATLEKVFNPRKIRQGHEVVLAFESMDEHGPVFQNMNLKLDVTRTVEVARCPENGFVAQDLTFELGTRPVRAEAEINSSLYNAAVNAGMPIEVLMQMIRAYSFDIDFQRDIQPGDQFAVLFEERLDGNGEFVRGGSVLYASLNTRGRSLPIYRYETSDGEVDFFNDKGQSVRKTLMVTPIDGARLSSGYGKRRHPILGYSRMHQGLDFAAPTGTPIMAAGDGVVEYSGRKGNYGNYIRLRHPNEYHTVYAHMSRFASGIRQGARVKQGEIIGYVGSTGLSTGPHLHYEVHHRGSHVNPATVVSPPGRTLKGEELERFMAAKKDLETLFASLEKCEKVARAD